MNTPDDAQNGATVVISHRVRAGKEAEYDIWLNEIGPLCQTFAGHLDTQRIRPIRGLTTTYTIVVRFDTLEHLRQWMSSAHRRRLIERVRPLLERDDDYTISSGLDFLFTPASANAVKVPVRWKQFLITWSAIYPLVLGVPLVLLPVLRLLGVPDNRLITSLFTTATVVALMVYVVMPHYTKWARKWLYA